jgi:cell division protein FtsL
MPKILQALLISTIFAIACSPKTVEPSGSKIQYLTIERQILEKNSKINSLNFEIEKQRLELIDLTQDIKKATEDAEKSAKKASDATTSMKTKVGDIGKAATADIYAENASKDTHKVYKLNSKLTKLNDDINDKQKQIQKLSLEVEKLKLIPTATTK